MNPCLHIPSSLAEVPVNEGLSIILGQRSTISLAASEKRSTAFVLAGFVACEDCSVVEEQIECLESVLPFGVDVLGFSGCANVLKGITDHSPGLKRRELIEVTRSRNAPAQLVCCVLGEPSKKVEVVTSDIIFVEARCAMHTCCGALPLLISSSGQPPSIVDGDSCAPLLPIAPPPSSRLDLSQLGVALGMLVLHVVIAPSLMSAAGLYEVLVRQLNAARVAGTTRLVELNAHNAHLLYCCRLANTAGAAAAEGHVSKTDWRRITEMVEDATGQKIRRADLRIPFQLAGGPPESLPKAPKGSPAEAVDATVENKRSYPWLLLALGVVVLLLGCATVLVH